MLEYRNMGLGKIISKNKYAISASLIILMAVFLFLNNLATKPIWYSDEGSALNVDWNLIHGQLRYLEISFNFIPHLPLFYLLSSLFVLFFGKTILAIRLFSGVCAISSIGIAYFIGKEIKGKLFGLASMAVLFVFSCFFITARYALPSSLDTLEIALVILFSIKYQKTENQKWMRYLSLVLSAALLTDVYLWGMTVVLPLLLWPRKKKLLAKSLAIVFFPFLIFFAVMLAIGGKGFINDIKYYYFVRIFSKSDFTVSPAVRIGNILKSWSSPFFWNCAGPIGLLFIPDKKIKKLFIILFLAITIPIFSFISMSFVIRNQILFMYLVSFGAVSLIFWAYFLMVRKFNLLGKLSKYAMLAIFFLAVIKSFQISLREDYGFYFNYNLHNREAGIISAITSYLNENAGPNDYVLTCDDSIFHLLNARVANIAQATAYQGMKNSIYSPEYVDKNRFYSDISIKKAKFAVYDEDLRIFYSVDEPNIVKAFEGISDWPVVLESGHYKIKKNPDMK
jgi:4-amino-4-deoxy-L-arabinose transferase-like glycosyltransferase